MRILLIDILCTSLDVMWPAVEHSLGLLYLAAMLRRVHGERVQIKIATLLSNPATLGTERGRVRALLDEWEPQVVGVRALTLGATILQLVAETTKEWDDRCLVIAGGPLATDSPEMTLRAGQVDCAAIGEGEWTFVELIGRLLSGDSYGDVAGLAIRDNGSIIRTPARTPVADLDSLPFPDWSLVDLEEFSNRYMTFTSKIFQRHGNILSTRGCPYRCMYCHNVLGKKFRARSPENVFAEIQHLHDTYGITDFQFVDDIFNLDLARAKAICDLIIRSRLKLTLSFPNGVRGDRMDRELIDKMAEAGTKFMSYAIETGSPRLQKLIHKNLKLDRVLEAIAMTTDVGIVTRGYFMLGFPGEIEEEALQTIEFAKNSALCGATFFIVVYYPGTELYRLARSMGYFREQDAELFREYVQIGDGPYEYSTKTLHHLKKKAISEFAFNKSRLDLVLRLLPAYFTPREIEGFLMAYVVSSGMSMDEVDDPVVRQRLRRHFLSAERFSRKTDFYV